VISTLARLAAAGSSRKEIIFLGMHTDSIDADSLSFTPSDCGATEVDDFVVFVFCSYNIGATFTTPNCTVIGSGDFTGNSAYCHGYGFVDGATLTSSTDITATKSSGDHAVVAMGFRNVDTVTPMDATVQTASASNDDPDPPSITVSTLGATVVSLAALLSDFGDTIGGGANLDDWGEANERLFTAGSAAVFAIGGYRMRRAPGAFDPDAWAASATTISLEAWEAATLALKPAT